jgi:hypothetical protein
MAFKLNNSDNYEPIMVTLSDFENPIAYNNKITELVNQELFPTIELAKKVFPKFEIELELYYEKDCGLFAVESGAVESGTIYSPYSKDLGEEEEI